MVLVLVSSLLALVLGTAFTSAGVAKMTDQPVMVRSRRHLRVRPFTYRAVGAAELLAAVGLVLGLLQPLAWIGLASAFGLVALMAAAVALHVQVGDAAAELAPAVTMGALAALYPVAVLA